MSDDIERLTLLVEHTVGAMVLPRLQGCDDDETGGVRLIGRPAVYRAELIGEGFYIRSDGLGDDIELSGKSTGIEAATAWLLENNYLDQDQVDDCAGEKVA